MIGGVFVLIIQIVHFVLADRRFILKQERLHSDLITGLQDLLIPLGVHYVGELLLAVLNHYLLPALAEDLLGVGLEIRHCVVVQLV